MEHCKSLKHCTQSKNKENAIKGSQNDIQTKQLHNNNRNAMPKLIEYNPSIIGQMNDIWWKGKLGNIFTSQNTLQSGEILEKYPNIVNDVGNKLNKCTSVGVM